MEVPTSKSLKEPFRTTVQRNTAHVNPPDTNSVHNVSDERSKSTVPSSLLSESAFDNESNLNSSVHPNPKSDNSLKQVGFIFLSKFAAFLFHSAQHLFYFQWIQIRTQVPNKMDSTS